MLQSGRIMLLVRMHSLRWFLFKGPFLRAGAAAAASICVSVRAAESVERIGRARERPEATATTTQEGLFCGILHGFSEGPIRWARSCAKGLFYRMSNVLYVLKIEHNLQCRIY